MHETGSWPSTKTDFGTWLNQPVPKPMMKIPRPAAEICAILFRRSIRAPRKLISGMFTPLSFGGGCGIRTREGVNPTRFPSVRHRPLGETSVAKDSDE